MAGIFLRSSFLCFLLFLNETGSGLDQCFVAPKCDFKNSYRTFDGTCNNLEKSNLGAANTPYRRILKTTYKDGVHEPPKSLNNSELPDSRKIRLKLFPDADILDPVLSLANMVYGQFIAHDCAFTLHQPGTCCPNLSHSDSCLPLKISSDDPRNSIFKLNQTCMEMPRSRTDNCDLKPRQIINSVTSYFDCSHIYGADNATAKSLRSFKDGKLLSQFVNGSEFPPSVKTGCSKCVTSKAVHCFKGDSRINQQPWLTSLHVLFLREHNRIAAILKSLNPKWDDEKLFQTSRKIIIAIHQYITYQQWLPYVVGEKMMQNKHLYVRDDGYHSNDYDSTIDPSLILSFNTGCFRNFHTMIRSEIPLFSSPTKQESTTPLSKWYLNPDLVVSSFEKILLGISSGQQQKADNHYSAETTEKLFRFCNPFGNDLSALDIQRSKDHGTPTYNSARQYCGIEKAYYFKDFAPLISPTNAQKIREIYEFPDDVPLKVGAALEELEIGALAGRTCNCLLAEQFRILKFGDRYFFTEKANGFTPAQLKEILKVTLPSLYCKNSKNITEIQLNIWKIPSQGNKPIPCSSIPHMDFQAWKE